MAEFQSRTVVCALLVNAQGEVLLQHRDEDEGRWSGHWSFFGGHVEQGESLEEGLAREILEEIDYTLTHSEPFFTFRAKNVKTLHIYLAPIDKEPEQLTLGEGQGFGFYTITNALKDLKLTPMARTSLEMLASYQTYRQGMSLFNDDLD